MSKVTIVVPVFNTNINDFRRCVNSILAQSFDDFTALIIDDGSKDNLSKLYKEECLKDKRFIYLKSENKGVSSARNIGIKTANSDYICFVDSDDTIDKYFLKESVFYLEKYNVKLAIGRMDYVDHIDNQGNDFITILNKDNIFDLTRAVDMCPQSTFKNIIKSTFAGKMFVLDVIKKNNLLFPNNIKSREDFLFVDNYFNSIETAIFIPNVWYHYYQNDYSFSHTNLKDGYIEVTKPYWNIMIERNKKEKDEVLKAFRYRLFVKDFFEAVRRDIVRRDISLNNKLALIEDLYKENVFIETIKYVEYGDSILQNIHIFMFKHKMIKIICISQFLRYKCALFVRRIKGN